MSEHYIKPILSAEQRENYKPTIKRLVNYHEMPLDKAEYLIALRIVIKAQERADYQAKMTDNSYGTSGNLGRAYAYQAWLRTELQDLEQEYAVGRFNPNLVI